MDDTPTELAGKAIDAPCQIDGCQYRKEITEADVEAGAEAICDVNHDDPDKPYSGGWADLKLMAEEQDTSRAHASRQILEYKAEARAVLTQFVKRAGGE